MPVPWSEERQQLPVEGRAITVQQLRDLRTYLQRLCKVGLLRDPRTKCRIDWFEINMYHITDLVIRPLIEYTEDVERRTCRRYSWAEFVAPQVQYAKIHFIHSWSGRFRDFMACVDALVGDQAMRVLDAVWICTFANSQFGEDFGTSLRGSPFCKSIQLAKSGSVLIVDRDGSSLVRIWCAFEMFLTRDLAKPLMLYTSGGRVGEDVKTGSLVEQLELYDVTLNEASQDADRRQILNYLAGGESCEMDGLKKTPDGQPLLVDGWKKQLDSQSVDPSKRLRANGKEEFEHEASLFEESADKFDDLNQTIRAFVTSAVTAVESNGHACATVDRVTDRGIRLGQWRTFAKRVKNWAQMDGPGLGLTWEKLTVDDVARKYVVSYVERETPDKENPLSYTEVLGNKAMRPQYMTDEPKAGSFADFCSTLEWFAEAMRLHDNVAIWCQVVCVRQNKTFSEFKDWNSVTLPNLLSDVDGLVSFLPKEEDLIVRCNRIFAWQLCFENAKELYLGCTGGVLSCGNSFFDGGWVYGLFDISIANTIINADWERANTTDPKLGPVCADRIRNSPGGFACFAGRLAGVAAGPVLREMAFVGGQDAVNVVRRLCRHEAVMLNSGVLSGCLQETAVHIAAGAGNIDVLQTLLDLQADPNAEDNIRETPLHYAALTGKARAVKLLLRHGAQAGAESAFAETPVCVAAQNPARFLGQDTKKVIGLLESWEKININTQSDNALCVVTVMPIKPTEPEADASRVLPPPETEVVELVREPPPEDPVKGSGFLCCPRRRSRRSSS